MRHIKYIKYTVVCIGIAMMFSCMRTAKKGIDDVPKTTAENGAAKVSVLITDEELDLEDSYNTRADELFDDFLYNYINDSDLQCQRTIFPLTEVGSDGMVNEIEEREWHYDFGFMKKEYTTNIYNDEREKSINEDTTLTLASLERIDLLNRTIVSFNFIKDDGKWNLKAIRHIPFDKSDLADFLRFYSRFTQDSCFNYASLARSIHISMMDPEDEEQSIDGFVTRDQWNTVHSGIPKGVITNIRYGQRYKNPKRILMEKISMGNGMSETFAFRRNGTRWELSGYEN